MEANTDDQRSNQAVDPDVVDGQVGVAAVVDEVRHVAVVSRVHRVEVALAEVEVQVEQVRLAVGIVDLEKYR